MDALTLQPDLARLAAAGLFLGTSSWKYPGWLGQLYDEPRYLTRGRFSSARLEGNSLQTISAILSSFISDRD